jgi:hypothetical protein
MDRAGSSGFCDIFRAVTADKWAHSLTKLIEPGPCRRSLIAGDASIMHPPDLENWQPVCPQVGD